MRRRDFLAASAAALAVEATPRALRAGEPSAKDLIELRTYTFASPAKMQAFDEFLASAAIPALGRLGIGPVGSFKLLKEDNGTTPIPEEGTTLLVLLAYRSAASWLSLSDRLADDPTFVEAAREVLFAPKSDPAYVRYESTILSAFDDAPRVEVPTRAPTRLLQLRIYESHSVERHLKKVEMFNGGGEIAIFRRCGMNPVFFGAALAGTRLPNLTYMLGFADKAAMDKAWGAFRQDPGWLQIKDDPAYKDTVSNITNLVLRPTASSQI